MKVARRTLNLEYVLRASIPLAPRDEQLQIVNAVEQMEGLADRAAVEVEQRIARCARLRQAILKRAFAGKLVPQDPKDKPTSVLLKSIRAGRAPALPSGKRFPSRKSNGEQRDSTAESSTPPRSKKKKPAKRDVFSELSEGFDSLKRRRDG